ncbi:MAG: nuclear transport factor 2 family protein [Sphingomonas sp.]|uniref:nuclear transport factor 2 family protein n=1 Tax=Sphingomonas sp. TaxID=28214 RepID=UPI001ACFF9BB|nr:nuclear transport factor 2 family protein [Sphingomonas sp.]MBN8808135.1 nuclear transport factor 2 family protein [Sphingomonas sp.]
MIRTAIAAIAVVASVPAVAAPARTADPVAAVEAFAAAQRAFDQTALVEVTAPDFVEISPLGEVDPRDRMLGFYAPDKKVAGPPVTMDERTVRTSGNLAIVTVRYAIGEHALRAVYVVRRDAGQWRLVSAQYTPIRVVKPA